MTLVAYGTEVRMRALARDVDAACGLPRLGTPSKRGKHVEASAVPGGSGWEMTWAEPELAPDGQWEYPVNVPQRALLVMMMAMVEGLKIRKRQPRPEPAPL